MSSLRRSNPSDPTRGMEVEVGEDGSQSNLTALAAAQRFSSPAARTAFCIIMGSSTIWTLLNACNVLA